MKKVLALSFFAIAALVSQAWSASCTASGKVAGCEYNNPVGCYSLTEEYSDGVKGVCEKGKCSCDQLITACKKDGALYSFSSAPSIWSADPWGGGATCSGNGGTLEFKSGCGSYCKWSTGCEEIKPDPTGDYGNATANCEEAIANCNSNGLRFDNATCSGTPIGGIQSCNQWCKWPTGCVEIKPDPSGQYGDPVPDCPTAISNCEANGQMFSSQSACESSSTPILKFPSISQALIVAPYGRSLHISSVKDAMVSLYDMSGARVYSGRVRAGNSVFGLEKVPAGSYYAIVQSGSSYKKVAVVLK